MVPLQKLKKAPPPPQVVWPYETGPEVFASQKLQGVFPNTSPKGGKFKKREHLQKCLPLYIKK
jgi:hypothetical protein